MTTARELLEAARAAGAYDGDVGVADRVVGARVPPGRFRPRVRRHGSRVALHAAGRAPSVHDAACLLSGDYRESSPAAHREATELLASSRNSAELLGRREDHRASIGGRWTGADPSRRRGAYAAASAGRAQAIHRERGDALRYLRSLSSPAVLALAELGRPHALGLAEVRAEWAELVVRSPELVGLAWLVQTAAGRRTLGALFLLDANAAGVEALPVVLLGATDPSPALAEATGWTYGRIASRLGPCAESGVELRPETLGHTTTGRRVELERAGLLASSQPPSELAHPTEVGRGPAALRYALPRALWEGAGLWGRVEHHEEAVRELLAELVELLAHFGGRAPREGAADHVASRMRRAELEARRAQSERRARGERRAREERKAAEGRRAEELVELHGRLEELADRLEAAERPPPLGR